jgi:hypothetical protein
MYTELLVAAHLFIAGIRATAHGTNGGFQRSCLARLDRTGSDIARVRPDTLRLPDSVHVDSTIAHDSTHAPLERKPLFRMSSLSWLGSPVDHLLFSRQICMRLSDVSFNQGRITGSYVESMALNGQNVSQRVEVNLRSVGAAVYHRLVDSANIWGYLEVNYHYGTHFNHVFLADGTNVSDSQVEVNTIGVGAGIYRYSYARVFNAVLGTMIGIGFETQRGVQLVLGIGTPD